MRLLSLALAVVPLFAQGAREVVWSGTQTVDRVVRFDLRDLVLKPGTRVVFVGEGRIAVRDGSFRAEGAELVATTVLTNNYRLWVGNGRLDMQNCRVRGLRSHEPVRGVCYYLGSMYSQNGGGSRLVRNTFVDSSPVAYVCADGVEVADNVFVRPREGGAYLFNVTGCRVVRNGFFDAPAEALQLNGSRLTEVAGNRFTDCAKGIRAAGIGDCRIVGNSFFGGSTGVDIWWDGKNNIYLANLFDGLSRHAVFGRDTLGDGAVFANNLVAHGGNGFMLPKKGAGRRLTVRDNAFVEVGIALRLDGGSLEASNNAVWKSKYGMLARQGTEARLATPGLVTADPLFRDAERGDWRLKQDSPLRGAGTGGHDIGLYQ